jgi:8-oxo-dGTP pyrophosphatase MutT (NUDIX family)/phosphohistidine phosphatase SixA
MPGGSTLQPVLAAGGVLWRPAAHAPAGFEIALVHRPRYDDWSLPKGKLEPDEDPLLGALREVHEETGYRAVPGRHLGMSTYAVAHTGVLTPKTVEWWAMRAGDGAFVPSDEVDELRWCSSGDAEKLLTAGRDADQVRLLESSGVDLSCAILVRHAAAGSRSDWSGDDDERPLSGKGRRQAAALAEQLGAFGVTALYSAPVVRCQQTLELLAERLGLPIRIEPLFGEQDYDPEATVARWREIVAEGGTPVICSQGGALPDLLVVLAREAGVGLADTRTRKGAAWVLSLRGGLLAAADYRPPPA